MNQQEELKAVLSKNTELTKVLERASQLGIRDWYVGAGAISATER